MKATELRIGNNILYNNEIRIVYGIRNCSSHLYAPVILIDLDYQYQKKVIVNIKEIEPIKITKKMLSILGLESYDEDNHFLTPRGSSVVLYKNGNIKISGIKFEGRRKLNFLHEFQNLYFAFYKEELIINQLQIKI